MTEWILPPKVKVLLRILISRWIGFTKVESWDIAVQKSVGYESEQVTDQVVVQALKIRNEIRSSEIASSRFQQVATALLYCFTARKSAGSQTLRILDFGGAGGDYYYQFQILVPHMKFEWTVLETQVLSNAMRVATLSVDNIKWISSIDEIDGEYDVVLCSSVLQYLQEPYDILKVLSCKAQFIILNRLPLVKDQENFVALQKIRTSGKSGSYPAHFFNEDHFLNYLQNLGEVVMKWKVPEDQPVVGWRAYMNQGLVLRTNRVSISTDDLQ